MAEKKEEAAVAEAAEPVAPAKKPSLRLQSKYREHRIMIRPTRRVFHEGFGYEPIPGLAVRFEGPQRIFDSAASQEKYGWSDEERDQVERKLVQATEFMNDYYPAPFSTIPEHLQAIARTKVPTAIRKCQAFGFNDGNLAQCDQPATAGRQWCAEHDPDVTRIVQGNVAHK